MSNNVAEYELYKRIKLLGEGSFGKAYLVEYVADGTKCVLKQVDLSKMTDDEKKDTLKEAKILEALNHPNIVRFREVYKTKKGKLCIVMDYADGGDLSNKVKEMKGQFFPETQILDWFTQMCLALKHVHDRKVIHRDLKCQNIFLTKSSIIKLGDFGIARVLSSTRDNAKTMVGTPYYLSPEIINGKPYSFKSDMWSLGVVLYEMCALKPPFDATSLAFLAMKIVKGQFAPIPGHYSKDLKNLISILLQIDPAKRPSCNNILTMPVIQNRVKNFLSESIRINEFSHTVLHRQNLVKPNARMDEIKNIQKEEPCPQHLIKNMIPKPEVKDVPSNQQKPPMPAQNQNPNAGKPMYQPPPSQNNQNKPIVTAPQKDNAPQPQKRDDNNSNQPRPNYHYKNGQEPPKNPVPVPQPYTGPKIVDASKFEKQGPPSNRDNKHPDNKPLNPPPQQKDNRQPQPFPSPIQKVSSDPKQGTPAAGGYGPRTPSADGGRPQSQPNDNRQQQQMVRHASEAKGDNNSNNNRGGGQPMNLEKYNWLEKDDKKDNNNHKGGDNNNHRNVNNNPDPRSNIQSKEANKPSQQQQPQPDLNRNKWVAKPISNDPVKVNLDMQKSPPHDAFKRKVEEPRVVSQPTSQQQQPKPQPQPQPVQYNKPSNPQPIPAPSKQDREILGGGFGGGGGMAFNIPVEKNNNNNNHNQNNRNANNKPMQDNYMKDKEKSNEKQKALEYEKRKELELKARNDKLAAEEAKKKERAEQERVEKDKKREDDKKKMIADIQENNKKKPSAGFGIEWIGGKPVEYTGENISTEGDSTDVSARSSEKPVEKERPSVKKPEKVERAEKQIIVVPVVDNKEKNEKPANIDKEFGKPVKVEHKAKRIAYKPPVTAEDDKNKKKDEFVEIYLPAKGKYRPDEEKPVKSAPPMEKPKEIKQVEPSRDAYDQVKKNLNEASDFQSDEPIAPPEYGDDEIQTYNALIEELNKLVDGDGQLENASGATTGEDSQRRKSQPDVKEEDEEDRDEDDPDDLFEYTKEEKKFSETDKMHTDQSIEFISDYSKIESLKILLEDMLGDENFLNAYKIVKDLISKESLQAIEEKYCKNDHYGSLFPFLQLDTREKYLPLIMTLVIMEENVDIVDPKN